MTITIDIPGFEGWLAMIALGVAALVVLNLLLTAVFGSSNRGDGDGGWWGGDGDGDGGD
jgi:hypothetical protein